VTTSEVPKGDYHKASLVAEKVEEDRVSERKRASRREGGVS